jgi:hypothetical protein
MKQFACRPDRYIMTQLNLFKHRSNNNKQEGIETTRQMLPLLPGVYKFLLCDKKDNESFPEIVVFNLYCGR